MVRKKYKGSRFVQVALLAAMAVFGVTACGQDRQTGENLIVTEVGNKKTVNLFSPMEKIKPNAENVVFER